MLTLSEVLADAYRNNREQFLVHAVNEDGEPVCGRVKADSLTGSANSRHTEPTCTKCLKAWQKSFR